jgi:hypothetical protein
LHTHTNTTQHMLAVRRTNGGGRAACNSNRQVAGNGLVSGYMTRHTHARTYTTRAQAHARMHTAYNTHCAHNYTPTTHHRRGKPYKWLTVRYCSIKAIRSLHRPPTMIVRNFVHGEPDALGGPNIARLVRHCSHTEPFSTAHAVTGWSLQLENGGG